jgi:RES domain-containing protein
VQVWRICKGKHQQTAFSGEALATLEVFVHTESSKIPLVAIRALLADDIAIEELKLSDLPSHWQDESAYSDLQRIGEDWLRSKRTPVLKVPSAILPVEYNYILNPDHPDLKFSVDPPLNFKFDQRMWKSSQLKVEY